MVVQPGLCGTWSDTPKTGFLTTRLKPLLQLKGCPSEDVSKEAEDMIEVLGLEQKQKALSHTVSGGQKHKLLIVSKLF